MADPSPETRYDTAALREGRAIAMYPVIAFGMALPFLSRWLEPYWEVGSTIAQARFLARVAMSFLLLACYPTMLVMIRVGVTDVTASQHRRLLSTYPSITTLWHSLLALDAFLLIAAPRVFSLPNFPLDFATTVLSAVLIPVIVHQQTYFVGFDANRLKQARHLLEKAPELAHARAPLDTLDYRVLQLVAKSSSDVQNVMINDMGIGHRDLMLRMSKLVALGYLNVVEELHGPQVALTTLATDTLALPVSLFTWDTDDRELLAELASARLSLEGREPQKVVVACARTCERLLRNALASVTPKITHIGTKELSKATLGDLIGAARANKLIGRFEDGIFSAINERRKKIHALEGTRPIDDQDAFVLYTLTEIAARDMLNPQERAPSPMSVVPPSVVPGSA
ncbi:MAG: hypothetical protein U0270_06060 [Labilithrix sp.]